MAKQFGVAVPDYRMLGISGPYFGDLVWQRLVQLGVGDAFEYIPVQITPFPDGSEKVVVKECCNGMTMFVIHSIYTEPAKHVMIGAEICDSLKRSDAGKIYMVELFNPYYRQDAREGCEPITARLVANIYKDAGMRCAFTADPHSKQLSGFFERLETLPMSGVLAEHVKNNYDLSDAIVVSPDQGGYARAAQFANLLGLPLAAMHKVRRAGHAHSHVEVQNILGDVRNKDVFMRDDMIAGGGTVLKAAEELRKRGARNIFCVVTHLGLYGDAKQKLQKNGIRVIGTNTVPHSLAREERQFVDVVDVSPIIADIIFAKSQRGSITHLFEERDERIRSDCANSRKVALC